MLDKHFTMNKPIHYRYEPGVNGGTTYAFHYEVGVLAIGRQCMHRTLLRIEQGLSLSQLISELVDEGSVTDSSYTDQSELLIDILKLLEAGVLTSHENNS